jgi:hypothetical protein
MEFQIIKAISTPKGLVEFRFEPLCYNGNTIFAIYCHYNGGLHCFHMAQEPNNLHFKIIDKKNCPYDFAEMEELLSNAIHAGGSNGNNYKELVDRSGNDVS